MGHPDGAHSHGSGGGVIVLAVLAVLAAAAVAGPVAAAAVALLHILLIIAAVLAGIVGAGLVAYAALRVHRWRAGGTTRVAFPAPATVRAVRTPPEPRAAIGRPAEIHLHFHGVSAEDVAAAIRQAQREAGD